MKTRNSQIDLLSSTFCYILISTAKDLAYRKLVKMRRFTFGAWKCKTQIQLQ